MSNLRRLPFFCIVIALTGAAQTQAPNSRAEEIESARQKKAANLTPEVASGTERFLVEVKERHILEKIMYGIGGLRPRIGALVTGSGFAAGPEYFRDDLSDGNVLFRVTTQFSTRQYQLYDVELGFPRLAGNHAFFDLHATHRNFPQMQYYGPGPDSSKNGRSNYRLEDTSYWFGGGVKPAEHLRLGVMAGFTEVNVGPGTDRRFISTEQIFGPLTTPGIDVQTDFLHGGVFAQFDYRDNPGGARRGGNYVARFTYNKDTDIRRHTFRKLDVELQQYVPFFNERRVIALRAKTELTYKNPNQTVPFYMQPTLGGSNDLRGFRPFRFYDDNLLVLNAEYRYEIFAGMDMAIFGDAGKVFRSESQLTSAISKPRTALVCDSMPATLCSCASMRVSAMKGFRYGSSSTTYSDRIVAAHTVRGGAAVLQRRPAVEGTQASERTRGE
jgi:outer membrane protein assembly factor BamA